MAAVSAQAGLCPALKPAGHKQTLPYNPSWLCRLHYLHWHCAAQGKQQHLQTCNLSPAGGVVVVAVDH